MFPIVVIIRNICLNRKKRWHY